MDEIYFTEDCSTFWEGIKDCIPTLLGYLSIGFAAGVVEKTAGLSIAEITLMSLLLYAGSAQFISAGMIMAAAPVTTIIFTVFFVNLRHLLLSAAISPYFKTLPHFKNIIVGSELTDETFGVSIKHGNKYNSISYKWMLGLNITAHLNWILATIIGGLLGSWIPNPTAFGLDFALPAMFIGLLILQIAESSEIIKEIIIIISSVATVLIANYFSPGNISVIIATILAATVGMVVKRCK
ncbi:MAG: AzlC family ABC transporter permease [Clostridiaceae bacterium]|nr:AzlC family ABC transporter permease [Clostridiaceae bacterium]